jgi:tetratricopeptide (TPR) repeat protein
MQNWLRLILPFYNKTLLGDAYPEASKWDGQALQLNEILAKAHTVLAKYKEHYLWDFAGAENEYLRSLELDLNDSTTHQWYAECLSHLARHGEAIREIKRVQELYPASSTINVVMG